MVDRQGIASLAVGEESFGPRGLIPTSAPDLSSILFRGPNLPAAAGALAAGMLPGSGVAEAVGVLPGSTSLTKDLSEGNYLDALLKGIGAAADATYMTPAAPIGAGVKAALALPSAIIAGGAATTVGPKAVGDLLRSLRQRQQVHGELNPDTPRSPEDLQAVMRLDVGKNNDIDAVFHNVLPQEKVAAARVRDENLVRLEEQFPTREYNRNSYPEHQKQAYRAQIEEVKKKAASRITDDYTKATIRPEISDSPSGLKPKTIADLNKMISGKGDGQPVQKLGEIFDHPELFKLYPKLKDVNVRFTNLAEGVLGTYLPGDNTIVLDPQQIRGFRRTLGPDKKNLYDEKKHDDVRATLLHEMQHVVDRIDPRLPPNYHLMGGANQKAFEMLLERVPKDVRALLAERTEEARRAFLENKEGAFKAHYNLQTLFDPFTNYRNALGEVVARQTSDRANLDILDRLVASDPKAMLRGAGIDYPETILLSLEDSPIFKLSQAIEKAQPDLDKLVPKERVQAIEKIIDDIVDKYGVKEMKDGGEVKVPQQVQDHFLAYINPQEAAMLQAMGGGITASGGQRMMNGIPSFRPSDNAAEAAANSTNDPDDVADPHGVGQPTSQNPMGGVPGVDDTAYDKAIRDLDEKAKQTPEEKAKSLSLMDALKGLISRDINYEIGFPGFSVPVGFSGLLDFSNLDITEDPEDPDKKKDGGEVKAPPNVNVPPNVRDHFLSYINPQEAAMLRAMGGGITAAGGQKMRNGVPIFEGGDNPGDDEGQGGAPAAGDTSGDPSEGDPSAGDDPHGYGQETSAPVGETMSGPEMDPSVATDTGIMGFGKSLMSRGLPATVAGYLDFGPQSQVGIQALSIAAGLFGGFPGLAAVSIPSLVSNAIDAFPGLDVDYDTDSDSDEGSFGQ